MNSNGDFKLRRNGKSQSRGDLRFLIERGSVDLGYGVYRDILII